ncbi:MAG: response regulator transcription factor [Firmicutes bacterium]|nr:response regulator transcription factor [Bacillota bacterium]
MYHIVVVDDDKEIRSSLQIYLEEEGYRVTLCANGQQALSVVMEQDVHLVLLDIMMPVMDGLETARRIRKLSAVPILFLTAKTQSMDMIMGLNAGADDYITKPFEPLELMARVRSNLRRYTKLGTFHEPDMLVIGGLVIDDKSKTVTVEGAPVRLTPLEYNLLLFFAKNKGQVFTIQQIHNQVWKEPFTGNEKKVVVHISHLREKIEINPREPQYLKAVWGLGYKMENL